MPAAPTWFQHIPAALQSLRQMSDPDIDRASLQQLLRVGYRTAVNLLHRFGASEVGNSLKIDREDLIRCLDAEASGDEYHAEARRRSARQQHLVRMEQEARSQNIRFPAPPPQIGSTTTLPDTIQLQRRDGGYQLTIRATSPLDILRQGYLLGLFASNDIEAYYRWAEPDTDEGPSFG
jgi:hypothetical protein